MRTLAHNPQAGGGGSIRLPLAEGFAGTAQTINVIRKLVAQGLADHDVDAFALGLVQDIQPYYFAGEAYAIWDCVRRNIQFRRDVTGRETLRTVREILAVKAGDCDDINAILLPVLLGAIGARTRLVTIANDPTSPNEFTHIYPEVLIRGQWMIPIDAAVKNPAWGVAPERYFHKRIWSLTDSSSQRVAGLGQDTLQDILGTLPSIETVGCATMSAMSTPYLWFKQCVFTDLLLPC
jgi:hypothetical protein